MKKLFILLLTTLFILPLQAKDGDQLTLEAGSPGVIYKISSAFFTTDFADAKVEGKTWDEWLQSKGDDYVRDWPDDQKKVEVYFMTRFNKKTKKKGGINLQNTNQDDRYRFEIHIDDIDMGSVGGGVVSTIFLGPFAKKSGGVNFKSGYIDIIDEQEHTIVCRLKVKDVRGDNAVSVTAMLINMFEDLYDEIFGFAERFGNQHKPEIALAAAEPEPEPEPEAVEAPAPAPAPKPAVKAKAPVKGKVGIKGNVKGKPAAKGKLAAKTPAAKPKPATSSSATSSTSTGGKLTAVKLKSGAVIKGVMKSIDPLSNIVIIIAGQETTIPMEKVESIEDAGPAPSASTAPATAPARNTASSSTRTTTKPATRTSAAKPVILGDRKLLVTETEDYPSSITVDVGGEPIELLLVKGGRMNMGWDGDHSMSMESEPVHEVAVTSFYMSRNQLTCNQIKSIFSDYDNSGDEPALVKTWEGANRLVGKIAEKTGKKFRLPTEAEWEYAASGDLQNEFFTEAAKTDKALFEWCSDYYDEFPDNHEVLTDPTGPMRGDEHVVRAYNAQYGKYNRNNKVKFGKARLGFVRLVIKASQY